jgi:hypothetical protein
MHGARAPSGRQDTSRASIHLEGGVLPLKARSLNDVELSDSLARRRRSGISAPCLEIPAFKALPAELGQHQAGETIETDEPHRDQEVSVRARDRTGCTVCHPPQGGKFSRAQGRVLAPAMHAPSSSLASRPENGGRACGKPPCVRSRTNRQTFIEVSFACSNRFALGGALSQAVRMPRFGRQAATAGCIRRPFHPTAGMTKVDRPVSTTSNPADRTR